MNGQFSDDIRQRPEFTIQDAELMARHNFGLDGSASELPSERDQNFRITTATGQYVLKIANPTCDPHVLALENQAIQLAQTVGGLLTADLIKAPQGGPMVELGTAEKQTWYVRCLSYVPGKPLATLDHVSDGLLHEIGAGLAGLDNVLTALNRVPAGKRKLKWDLLAAPRILTDYLNKNKGTDSSRRLVHFLDHYSAVESRISQLPRSVIHNDANDYNILASDEGVGIIDFGDIVFSSTVNDLAICLAYAMMGKPDPLDIACKIVDGYHTRRRLSELEISCLYPLTCLRLCQSVCISSEQREVRPDDDYLAISEQPAWELLDQLAGISPTIARQQFTKVCQPSHPSTDLTNDTKSVAILKARQKWISPSLSLAYNRPLHLVRGRGQYLYDTQDLTYLDCVNNVCHVGHCHPKVVDAARHQIATLNTNTRYLHENIVRLADRLVATLPSPLEVCFFVNSGSEANDLALRLARAHSGNQDFVVIDHAYHGHTASLIEISPYKFSGHGGNGQAQHVHVVPAPDTYRGEFRSDHSDCGPKFAAQACDIAHGVGRSGRGIAAFFAESLLGCGGQVPLPAGYLAPIYESIHDMGGICVADEVQVGFGRVGSHFWGFETQGVVPDIVTMGKPMGNGHPLAAVVTTRDIAESFHNGMEYFNTFGGNPVSCAIGLAVLDVIVTEDLQQHALELGTWLIDALNELKTRHSVVGDIRGSGLFLGIELVLDRISQEPATELAKLVVNDMRRQFILLSTDGPFDNVIKFKPPLVIGQADAERLVTTLDRILTKLCLN